MLRRENFEATITFNGGVQRRHWRPVVAEYSRWWLVVLATIILIAPVVAQAINAVTGVAESILAGVADLVVVVVGYRIVTHRVGIGVYED